MHLKPDPVAVEFLKQFGLLFLFVIFGAMRVVGYSSLWSRSRRKHSSKHKHSDEPRGDK
jgi:fatty-acid desaturase